MSTPATSSIVPARLDDLVLARAALSAQPPTVGELARSTRALAPTTIDDARWAALIADAVARLQTAGALDHELRAPGGAPGVAARLGAGGAIDWKRVQDRIVPGLALGLAANDSKGHARLRSRDAWVAAVLGRSRRVWSGGPPPSLAAVGDALVWQALALAGKPGRNPKPVRAHFVNLALGGGAGPFEKRAALLAAQDLGAQRADVGGLRAALVRRWLCGLDWDASAAAPAAPRPPTAAATDDFAAAVRGAAARATDGRFGPRKVFIASVWRDAAFSALSLADFKARLLAAHRAGAITLARADLVAAMDPDLVRESEVAHLDSRYHFVETGSP
jgi:hypothetical protein